MKHYRLSIALTAVIIFLSLYPFGPIELAADVPLADKWTHMLMYTAMALVAGLDYGRAHRQMDGGEAQGRQSYVYHIGLLTAALLLPIALGGLLELAQAYLTTYRSGEWMDWLADGIGAAVGYALILLAKKSHFLL